MLSPTEQRRRYVEFASAILLAVAGLATSWSTYQASLWGGLQATQYSRANGLRVESTRAHETADHLYTIDIGVFSSWVNAHATGNTALENFYRQRFRPEFKPAFADWLALDSGANPGDASTPFVLPSYRLAKEQESADLAHRSDAAFSEGEVANGHSDSYVLNAVLLASVLFFSGIAQQFRTFRVQLVLLGFAGVLLTVGICSLAILPRQ
jgi:hypothetical protein